MSKTAQRQLSAFEFAREVEERVEADPALLFGDLGDDIRCDRVISFRENRCVLRFIHGRDTEATTVVAITIQITPQSKTKVAFKVVFQNDNADPAALPLLLAENAEVIRRHAETVVARLGNYISRLRREGHLDPLLDEGPAAEETAAQNTAPAPEDTPPTKEEEVPATPETPSPPEGEPAAPEKYVPEADPNFPVRIRAT